MQLGGMDSHATMPINCFNSIVGKFPDSDELLLLQLSDRKGNRFGCRSGGGVDGTAAETNCPVGVEADTSCSITIPRQEQPRRPRRTRRSQSVGFFAIIRV